jgi:hypothetical protein
MKTLTGTPTVTFAVHPVERATSPLPTLQTHAALKDLLRGEVESCCDYSADCVRGVAFHPLLAAAHLAFSQHRPLALSPDMVWVAVAQGLAQHVRNHAERLRGRFVGHQGKLTLQVERTDLHRGSPENAWGEVVHDFSRSVRAHLGARYDELVADFSTTGPAERAACEVALLDAFRPYFEYRVYCVCGIPEVTLEGTADDWRRLREKLEHVAPYDLDWWLPSLRRVADQFVRAAAGDVDLTHWKDLYKQEQAYGADVVNGWLVQLVPYLKNGRTGNFTVRNPLLEDPDAEVSTDLLPSGVSQVPFRCRWRREAEDSAMEFLGGFVGVTQDAASLALRPKLGWAVRQGSELDRLLARLAAYSPAPPLEAPEFDRRVESLRPRRLCELPGDLLLFYKTCDGVDLFADGGRPAYRFRPLGSVELVEGGSREARARQSLRATARWPASATWRTAPSWPSSCGTLTRRAGGWSANPKRGRAGSSPGPSGSSSNGRWPAGGGWKRLEPTRRRKAPAKP